MTRQFSSRTLHQQTARSEWEPRMASRCQPLDRPEPSRQASIRGPPAKRGTVSSVVPHQAATTCWGRRSHNAMHFSIGEIAELASRAVGGLQNLPRTFSDASAQRRIPSNHAKQQLRLAPRGEGDRNLLLHRYTHIRAYTHTMAIELPKVTAILRQMSKHRQKSQSS